MFGRPKLLLFLLIFCIGMCVSCKKDKNFSDTPLISLTSFEQVKTVSGKDSIGIIHIKFTDGDGDVGLNSSDTFPPFDRSSPYYYNLYINYFEKQLGKWVRVVLPPIEPGGDTLSNHSRIPYLTPTGQNKTLEGDLSMNLFTNNPFSVYDTIKYEVTIVDRGLHRSNQIKTSDIILSK